MLCIWYPYLTHWGRITHICVSNLTITCPDNGSSPGRSHYLNHGWDIVNWTLRNKLQWQFNWKSYVTATGQVTVIWMSQYAVCRLTASLLVISGSYLYRRVRVFRFDTARVSCALLVKSPCSGAADHSLAPCLSEWTRRNSWGWYRTQSALFDWVCIIVCSYME